MPASHPKTAVQPPKGWIFALCRLLIQGASLLVPSNMRHSWKETWDGEVWHHWHFLDRRQALNPIQKIDLLGRCLGAFTHAAWCAAREWRTDPMLQDLRYALRNLAKRPGFVAVVLLCLGLGIGANTLVMGIVDGLVLRPFPYPDVDRLVALTVAYPKLGGGENVIEAISPDEVSDVESQLQTLEHILAFDMGNRDLGGVEEPQRLFAAFVWGDPFKTLAMPPLHGRGFSDEEIERQDPVAILSHRVFMERFAGDPSAVGQPIIVNGTERILIGVMPPRLLLLDTDLWMPMWASRTGLPRNQRQMTVLARLKDDVSLKEVNSELATVASRVEGEYAGEFPEYAGWRLRAKTFNDVWASFVGPAGFILLAAISFVLLIICSNVAGLLLARGAGRQREMAVRTALGAGRFRLARQLLAESFLLALGGGLLGLAMAYGALEPLTSLLPAGIPGGIEFGIDGLVLGYTLLISLASGLVFGLAPALISSQVRVTESLSSESRNGLRFGGAWFRRALVVGEMTLALGLLIGTGLLAQSFSALESVDPGIDTENVLTMRLTLPWQRYQGEEVTLFFEQLVLRTQAIPGVKAAAVASQFPPAGFLNTQFQVEGETELSAETLPKANFTIASPQLFETLGMPLVRGRGFDAEGPDDGPMVCVINQSLAKRYFSATDPLGRRLQLGRPDGDAPWATVVGVVADTRNQGPGLPVEPEIFVSLRASAGRNNQLFLVAKTETESLAYLPAVREAVRAIDPHQPVYNIRTLEQAFEGTLLTHRVASGVLVAFSALALMLVAIGLYGLIAHNVSERTREIGIRMALGAGRQNLMRWVLSQALKLALLGVVFGVGLSVVLSRFLESLLFGVTATDPWTLIGFSTLLVAVALIASVIPARRAVLLDPAEALRDA